MNQINPLLEFLFVDSKSKTFHKGQFKQNQFAMRQLRDEKNSLENKLAKIVLHKQTLEKKLSVQHDPIVVKKLNYQINQLDKRIQNVSALIRTKNGQIASRGRVLATMSKTNSKVKG